MASTAKYCSFTTRCKLHYHAIPCLVCRFHNNMISLVDSLVRFLLCFSLYTNGYKILSFRNTPGSISCLHGVRFISLSWVILGHALVFSLPSVSKWLTLCGWLRSSVTDALWLTLCEWLTAMLWSKQSVPHIVIKTLQPTDIHGVAVRSRHSDKLWPAYCNWHSVYGLLAPTAQTLCPAYLVEVNTT